MKFETGLEFGRNAAIINEAYSKMRISEGESDAEMENDEVADTRLTGDDFEGGSFRTHSPTHRRIPGWLKAAAKKAGHEFPAEFTSKYEPETDDSNVQLKNIDHGGIEDILNGNFDASLPKSDTEDSEDSEGTDGEGSADDNFYENVVEANPDVFNSDNYDMEALASNKTAIREKALDYMKVGYAPVEAVEKALEEIEGCGYIGPEPEPEQDDSEVEQGDVDSVGNIDDEDVGESCCRKAKRGKRRINEGAGAGYTITLSNLKLGEVTSVEKDETGGYKFTAKIVPGDYEMTADSYYDRYFPLGDWDDATVQIDGGEIDGSIGTLDDGLEGEELASAIKYEIDGRTITISTMYGGGWIHQFLPEDGNMTFDHVDIQTPDVYFDVSEVRINSKNMAEAINYGYEHCNDEDEAEVEDDELETQVGTEATSGTN